MYMSCAHVRTVLVCATLVLYCRASVCVQMWYIYSMHVLLTCMREVHHKVLSFKHRHRSRSRSRSHCHYCHCSPHPEPRQTVSSSFPVPLPCVLKKQIFPRLVPHCFCWSFCTDIFYTALLNSCTNNLHWQLFQLQFLVLVCVQTINCGIPILWGHPTLLWVCDGVYLLSICWQFLCGRPTPFHVWYGETLSAGRTFVQSIPSLCIEWSDLLDTSPPNTAPFEHAHGTLQTSRVTNCAFHTHWHRLPIRWPTLATFW